MASYGKNNNKSWNKDRRYKAFCGKKSKKQYNHEVVARDDLSKYQKQMVEINAEMVIRKSNESDPTKPVLLQHVYVNGDVYVDHIWVKISAKDRRKLKFWSDKYRVLMTGYVHEYGYKNDREIKLKYGLTHVKLKER